MNRHALFATVALAVCAPLGVANAQDAAQSPETMQAMQVTDSAQFITMAAMSDMFEIESSELAQENAQGDAVKQFAQQMIQDHTANTEKLIETVKAAGGEMRKPDALDDRHQAMVDQLEKASAEQFDAAYIDAQVTAHQEAVALLTGYAQNGDNDTMKAFAAQQLPVIQMHYEMVQKIDQGM